MDFNKIRPSYERRLSMKWPEILKLVASLVICELAGVVGSVVTRTAIPTWYRSLNKPSFTPPSWLFGPV